LARFSFPRRPGVALRGLLCGASLGLGAAGCIDGAPKVTVSDELLQCSGTTAGPAGLRLLTRVEYDNTVRDLLGDDSRIAAAEFPRESQVLGFDNNAETNQANPLLVAEYMEAAEQIASRAVTTRLAELAPCPGGADYEIGCGQAFVNDFGRLAFRRPLEGNEATVFNLLFGRAYEGMGYTAAVRVVLEAMLQSPQFLYRVEVTLTDDPASAAVPLGPYEMASRLSYFFWNSMPDAELLDAAAASGLGTRDELELEARRLLGDPRAHDMVSNFHRLYLALDELDAAVREVPDGVDADALPDDWRQSLAAWMDDIFWNQGTIEDLFTSPRVYLTGRLAGLYGPLEQANASGLVALDVPSERRGLLTQPGLMALLSHAEQTSPVRRGVFLREHILCEDIPDPPPTVDNTPPDPDPNATTRERFRVHTADETCATCHRLIDGIGFGFEHYDQLGRYRDVENGIQVDASGNVVDAHDDALNGPYDGIFELTERLAKSPEVRDCLATHWYRYAMGRAETELDACSLAAVQRDFSASGGDLHELLVEIALTDAFRYRPRLKETAP
jgi:hypothetical protein